MVRSLDELVEYIDTHGKYEMKGDEYYALFRTQGVATQFCEENYFTWKFDSEINRYVFRTRTE